MVSNFLRKLFHRESPRAVEPAVQEVSEKTNLVTAVQIACQHMGAGEPMPITMVDQPDRAILRFNTDDPKVLAGMLGHLFMHEISKTTSATRYIAEIKADEGHVDVIFRNVGTHRYLDLMRDHGDQWHLVTPDDIQHLDSMDYSRRLAVIGRDDQLHYFTVDHQRDPLSGPRMQQTTVRALSQFLQNPFKILAAEPAPAEARGGERLTEVDYLAGGNDSVGRRQPR